MNIKRTAIKKTNPFADDYISLFPCEVSGIDISPEHQRKSLNQVWLQVSGHIHKSFSKVKSEITLHGE